MTETQTLEAIVEQEDPLDAVIKWITDYPKEEVPVPDLAKRICVKPVTLNARILRNKITTIMVGRTSYITKQQAKEFACLNASSILGWPTVYELAEELNANAKTLAFWCNRGEIESQIDLAKKYRVNPNEKENIRRKIDNACVPDTIKEGYITYYSLSKAAKDAASQLAERGTARFKEEHLRLYKRFLTQTIKHTSQSIKIRDTTYVPEDVYLRMINPELIGYGVSYYYPERKKRKKPIKAEAPNKTPVQINSEFASTEQQPVVLQSLPRHKVKIITASDYNLPEQEQTTINQNSDKSKPKKPEKGRILAYNPDFPPSVLDCRTGMSIRYMGETGKIESILGDEFNPVIKVYFPGREEKLSYMNLVVRNKYSARKS